MARSSATELRLQTIAGCKFRAVEMMDLQHIFLTQELWGTLCQNLSQSNLSPSLLQSRLHQAYLLWSCLLSYLISTLLSSLLWLPTKNNQPQKYLADAGLSFLEIHQNRLLVSWIIQTTSSLPSTSDYSKGSFGNRT